MVRLKIAGLSRAIKYIIDLMEEYSKAEAINWRTKANCVGEDTDLFFPKDGISKEAKAICEQCEVRAICLEYALSANLENGIWGGASESERRRIKRSRRLSRDAIQNC